MKKVLTIFLFLLYTVSSIGATVTSHACAGKVKTCKCGKPAKKDLCCTTKTTYLKSQDNHQFQVRNNTITKKINLSIEKTTYINNSITELVLNRKTLVLKKSIIDTGQPIYEFICVYLI